MAQDEKPPEPPHGPKVGISGIPDVEKEEQKQLPPRGKAREGQGTHDRHRREPS